jgi:hypothetical protein
LLRLRHELAHRAVALTMRGGNDATELVRLLCSRVAFSTRILRD